MCLLRWIHEERRILAFASKLRSTLLARPSFCTHRLSRNPYLQIHFLLCVCRFLSGRFAWRSARVSRNCHFPAAPRLASSAPNGTLRRLVFPSSDFRGSSSVSLFDRSTALNITLKNGDTGKDRLSLVKG